MCGINGFAGINIQNKEKLLEKMNEAIKHRGPDDIGFFIDENKLVGLGHVRLSIIDLSNAGHQPMFYNKKLGASSEKFKKELISKSKISITYNGELYNYKKIKKKLEALGYFFTTQTDTEVILASYQEWGINCVKEFNGMWAFCIYDIKKSILFLSRDIIGEKPLFYYINNGTLIFSSELKGILTNEMKLEIDEIGLDLYNSLSYIPSPYSIFKNVYKLEPRHNLIYDMKNDDIIISKYYEYPKFNPINNKEFLIKKGKKVLEESIKLRMLADVPIGAFLSGGLDSSSIVSFMKKNSINNIHTFSIGFKNHKEDETEYINIIKNKVKTIHHHEYFNEDDYGKYLPKIQYHFDEPANDSAFFSNFKVAELAKKYVSVSITGDGGDEIFGGYNKHKLAARIELLQKIPRIIRKISFIIISAFKKESDFTILGKIREFLRMSLSTNERFFIEIFPNINFYGKYFQKWSQEKMKEMLSIYGNLTESVIKYDLFYNSTCDRFLQKVDRTSMAYGLETRSPFFDKNIIEYSCNIPTKWKTNGFGTKIILRSIMKKYLPKEIIKGKKKGFGTPLKSFINKYKGDVIFFKNDDVSMREKFLILWGKKYFNNYKK